MIDSKFTDKNIIGLMAAFEEGRYKDVQGMVTDNADAPTIFEYVLAIVWYKISERKGKVLDYMNLFTAVSHQLPVASSRAEQGVRRSPARRGGACNGLQSAVPLALPQHLSSKF